MKLSRKPALTVIPLVFLLSGCNTANKATAPSAITTPPPAQTVATQGAAVDVYAASNAAINGYRPIQLNSQQAIYISPRSVVNRSHIRRVEIVKDTQGRNYVKLTLSSKGAELISVVPSNQGFATTVDGQLASLTGVRQGSDFLFKVRDQQVAADIVRAIAPQKTNRQNDAGIKGDLGNAPGK